MWQITEVANLEKGDPVKSRFCRIALAVSKQILTQCGLVHLSYPCGIQILVQMSPVEATMPVVTGPCQSQCRRHLLRLRVCCASRLRRGLCRASLLCVQATPRALRKQPAARRLSESCCQLVRLHLATLMTGAQDEPIVARMDGTSTKMSLLRTQHGDREITLWRLRAISHHVSGSATAD